ncbi:hypothetical protein [Rufibacter quisquiliarum]|uniref:Uncharacterized protein n=1 Tax=Rufibacter quisquiliarum TaxID=1549639 RepID=A0A839GRP1_9BACT|nr:hypothetical protein [Rufibacter quisquiliarum]MBA9077078.1 hypothetical protein [Rufibacter quisquiliarum]
MHYQDNLYELGSDEIFHIIHLVGNPKEGILYCYVDYFCTYKYLVLLDEEYKGEELTETYCYDLINNQTLNRRVNLDYNKNTLIDFFINKDKKPFDRVKKAFDHAISIGLKRQDDFHRAELLDEAVKDSLGSLPENTILTKVILDKAANEVVNKIMPYIFRKNEKQ